MIKTLGKVAGGVGLLLALTSVLTFAQTTTGGAIKLGIGLACIAAWFFTNRSDAANLGGSLFFYGSSAVMGVVIVGVLVAANFIVSKRSKSWDLTSKKLYSLSPQTTTVLKELKDPIKIIAFSETPVPPVEDLIKRYQGETDKITFEFKDPNRANDLTKKYEVHQGQLAAVLVKNPGPNETHQLVNLGSLAQATDGEQTLTNALIKLNTVGQQKLYFIEGHGEFGLTNSPDQSPEEAATGLTALKQSLEDDGYAPEELNLTSRGEVPADASALVVARATSKFTDRERGLIEGYLAKGGRMVYFAEQGLEPELDALLTKYGVQVDPGVVADSHSNAGQPYAIISGSLGDSEIVKPLKSQRQRVLFAGTRGLTVLKEGMLPGVVSQPLVLSSPTAWIELQGADEPTLDPGEKSGQIALAAVATHNTANEPQKRTDEARVVVFGDADLLTRAYTIPPDRDMVLNAFAWATQQSQKITIRPPDRDTSTLDIDAQKFSNIRLLTADLLPTVLLAVGLTIARSRKAR